MKKYLLYILILCVLYFLPSVCHKLTDGFSLARIHSEFPEGTFWETPPVSPCDREEWLCALNQSYRYLASGGQCFAFLSEDNRYVIKFFKTRFNLFGSLFFQTMPFIPKERRQRKIDKALFKLRRDFTSYTIANCDLKKESAILYVHLNKSTDLHKTLSLTDKLGIHHIVDLDRLEFAIQRHGELAFPYIESLIQKNEIEHAKSAMRSLIDISRNRCQKGIYDEDAKIERNFGFLEDQPFFIDIGRFVRDPSRQNPSVYKKDLQAITRQLRTWIETHHPELTDTFIEML